MIAAKQEEDVFVQPGEVFFGASPARARTLLGSCVSVTLWHPRRRIGSLCHYMLPTRGRTDGVALDGKYADEAVALLLKAMHRAQAKPGDFVVKLFGGGNMFPYHGHGHRCGRERCDTAAYAECRMVSCKNVEAGRALLAAHGLVISAEHVGGVGHRHLVFDVASGDVWLRHAGARHTGPAWAA